MDTSDDSKSNTKSIIIIIYPSEFVFFEVLQSPERTFRREVFSVVRKVHEDFVFPIRYDRIVDNKNEWGGKKHCSRITCAREVFVVVVAVVKFFVVLFLIFSRFLFVVFLLLLFLSSFFLGGGVFFLLRVCLFRSASAGGSMGPL